MKDKKQTVQIVVVAVLLVGIIGYFAVSFMAPKKAPVQGKQPASKVAVAQPVTTDQGVMISVASNPMIAAKPRDPFSPMIVAENPSFSSAPVMSQSRTPVFRSPDIGQLPPMGVPLGAGGGSIRPLPGPVTPTTVAQPEQTPIPQFQLTGVVSGKFSIGIIRLGESRYIVREGEKINGLYEVVSVSREGVLIKCDGRSVFLRLGGEGNATK